MLSKIIDLLEIYMKITIIGNNASNGIISDGGRIKIRLFKSILESVGYCAQNRAKKYTYGGNRDIFLNIFTGDNL